MNPRTEPVGAREVACGICKSLLRRCYTDAHTPQCDLTTAAIEADREARDAQHAVELEAAKAEVKARWDAITAQQEAIRSLTAERDAARTQLEHAMGENARLCAALERIDAERVEGGGCVRCYGHCAKEDCNHESNDCEFVHDDDCPKAIARRTLTSTGGDSLTSSATAVGVGSDWPSSTATPRAKSDTDGYCEECGRSNNEHHALCRA